ncbi:phosphonate C-P lyase system protein PhnH [Halorhabdus amylolytica]|uniref:phosphonate C-P lyase system protein PhnH n=1 Tax=Halorhabdus amylolytica TaxID=2559573 RepID=UPI0010A9FA81|nr:phosphonate C-P lyase system protein PhnH [Halorhabdus amylolytica]
MRALGLHPVEDTRRTFRALLSAMSRPGTVESVPAPADRAVVSTLVDHEMSLATDDDRLRETLASRGRLHTQPVERAAVVHATDHTGWDVRECARGTLSEPADGATVIYRVPTIVPEPDQNAATLTLTGPGVDGRRRLSIELPESELDALAAAQDPYPRGVDAIFACDARIAAVPRSATLEVA